MANKSIGDIRLGKAFHLRERLQRHLRERTVFRYICKHHKPCVCFEPKPHVPLQFCHLAVRAVFAVFTCLFIFFIYSSQSGRENVLDNTTPSFAARCEVMTENIQSWPFSCIRIKILLYDFSLVHVDFFIFFYCLIF